MLNESIKRFPENKFCLSIFLLLLVFCTNPSLNVGSLWSKSQVQTCRISFNEKQLISSSSNIQQLKNKTSPYSPNHVGSPTNLHFLGLLLTGWQAISWATRVSHPHLVEVAIAQGGVELLAANNEVPRSPGCWQLVYRDPYNSWTNDPHRTGFVQIPQNNLRQPGVFFIAQVILMLPQAFWRKRRS